MSLWDRQPPDDGRDVLAFRSDFHRGDNESFILVQHVAGVEMGIGAYFDLRNFSAIVPR